MTYLPFAADGVMNNPRALAQNDGGFRPKLIRRAIVPRPVGNPQRQPIQMVKAGINYLSNWGPLTGLRKTTLLARSLRP